MNLLISAGEASGDAHGARLLAALRKKKPSVAAFGMGGRRLAAAGLDREVFSEELSVVGISEVFEKLPALWRALRRLKAAPRPPPPPAPGVSHFPAFPPLP